MAKVLLGRIWRKANRLISRAWLRTQVQRSHYQFERFGEGHAAWWVLSDIEPGKVAYCGGVGLDATFDFTLAEAKGLEVHSFDPTPHSIEYMARENRGRVAFHPWGLLDRNETIRFHAPIDRAHANWFVDNLHDTKDFFEAPCFTLATIMEKLGHEEIELLKIDIEGSWNRVLARMLEDRIYPRILCVEFDSPAPLLRVRKTVRSLKKAGYTLARRDKENCVFVKAER